MNHVTEAPTGSGVACDDCGIGDGGVQGAQCIAFVDPGIYIGDRFVE